MKWARSRFTSTLHTRTRAVGGSAVFTASSHMAHRFNVGVLRAGLSGRGPHGVSQTSSTRRLRRIWAQQRTWSIVGGSNAPPKMATRTFPLLSAAMRRTANAAMMAAKERIVLQRTPVVRAAWSRAAAKESFCGAQQSCGLRLFGGAAQLYRHGYNTYGNP